VSGSGSGSASASASGCRSGLGSGLRSGSGSGSGFKVRVALMARRAPSTMRLSASKKKKISLIITNKMLQK
jgi:hypothetical protein